MESEEQGREQEQDWGGEFDPLGDAGERRVLFGALDSFRQYAQQSHYHTTHVRRQAFYALPTAHWTSLSQAPISYLSTLDAVDEAIGRNARLSRDILSSALASFSLPVSPEVSSPLNWHNTATANDHSKASTILRQFTRDWSSEGAAERNAHFAPIVDTLCARFPTGPARNTTRVLVPGAGLGRLVFEICARGFHAEGCEISYHALLASSFVLNHIPPGTTYDLYPYATSFANRVSRTDQLRAVSVPDVHPGEALAAASTSEAVHAFERMEMAAGDFTVVYGQESRRAAYDAVATVFFIDTAPNIIRYIEAVRNCLKPGGLWLNLGPLLWHFQARQEGQQGEPGQAGQAEGEKEEEEEGQEGQQAGSQKRRKEHQAGIAEPGSVELTDEEVLELLRLHGFEIEAHEIRPAEAGYIQDSTSMLQNLYRVSFWVARRK
ncbi:MAG: hypothetical protein M1825_004622 [Sarcosagium campestre]|nr:MAG: hypothetical protein M1825_004622 [Sarcosagium campestre]